MGKRKRCEYCGDLKDDVIDGLCGECDGQHMTRCHVCKCNVSRDRFCRHIFWTADGDVGSGTYETDWGDAKPWVGAFCDLLEPELVRAIRSAIASAGFYMQYTCSMLGGFAHIWTHGLPWQYHTLHDHFDQRAMSEDERMGLEWLFTLFKGDTAKANAVTVAWLDEWLGARLRHETLMVFHAPSPPATREGAGREGATGGAGEGEGK